MPAAKDTEVCRAGRDRKGRFLKGNKVGKGGRPAGSSNRALLLCRSAAEEILPGIIERAREGDPEAERVVLTYGLPKLKPSSLPVEMPGTAAEIVAAMTKGDLAADVAQEAVGVFLTEARLREISELEARVAELADIVAGLAGKVGS